MSTVLQTEARKGTIDQEVNTMGRNRNKESTVTEDPRDGDYSTPDDGQTFVVDAEPAVAADAPAPAAEAATEAPKERKQRGDLESEVKAVTDAFVTGSLVLADGEFLTPHRIGKEIAGESGAKPSTGAIQSAIKRWQDCGFATVNEKPYAFVDYTDEGRELGLSALKTRASDARKAEKAAAKAAAAPAADASPEGVA